jgi:hypothetical protein
LEKDHRIRRVALRGPSALPDQACRSRGARCSGRAVASVDSSDALRSCRAGCSGGAGCSSWSLRTGCAGRSSASWSCGSGSSRHACCTRCALRTGRSGRTSRTRSRRSRWSRRARGALWSRCTRARCACRARRALRSCRTRRPGWSRGPSWTGWPSSRCLGDRLGGLWEEAGGERRWIYYEIELCVMAYLRAFL